MNFNFIDPKDKYPGTMTEGCHFSSQKNINPNLLQTIQVDFKMVLVVLILAFALAAPLQYTQNNFR